MAGYHGNIEQITDQNTAFRRVVYTGSRMQIVVMSLKPGEEIGEEIHPATDQLVFVGEGSGQAIISGVPSSIGEDSMTYVPAGTKHNFKNVGGEPLKLYEISSPPVYAGGTVHETMAEAHVANELKR